MIIKQTTLDLNGPIIEILQNPVNVGIVTNGSNVTFSGIVTAVYPSQTPPNPAQSTGTLLYQWYDNNGPLTNQTRTNSDGTTSVISGVTSTTLSITNVQYFVDDVNSFYLVADLTPSAYSGGTTPNAINEPLTSESVTIEIFPILEITLQPTEITDASTEVFSTFNVNAGVIDPTLDSQITYQWRLNGSNLSDNANVIGSRTNQLNIKQPQGSYTIDCVVSHPLAKPSPIISNSVNYTTEDPRQIVNIESYERTPNLSFSSFSTNLKDANIYIAANINKIYTMYAPERNVEVLIEMAAAGGQSFGGVQGGQGGWGVARLTLEQNVEYAIVLGGNNGGQISGTRNGAEGGGLSAIYKKNRLIAVLGGGGGAGSASAGGDGGGFNQNGQNGFGRNGGRGDFGDVNPSYGSDRLTPKVDGGTMASCPQGENSPDIFRSQGLSRCSDYTQSGKFTDASDGFVFSRSAEINRGFRRVQQGSGIYCGGWGLNGQGGAGGAGVKGGDGSRGNNSGGGGGTGWLSAGDITLLRTIPGVNNGNGYIRISTIDATIPIEDQIPNPEVPAPPNYQWIYYNDNRNPGYFYGRGYQGTYITGLRGISDSPPTNYSDNFTNSLSWRNNPLGTSVDFLSYIEFRIYLRQFGPRGAFFGDSGTLYLTSNRGDLRIRRWYTTDQALADREPQKWTTNRREAFVPFRLDFELKFRIDGGRYNSLIMTKSQTYNYFDYPDIEFSSAELADQNNIPRNGGRLIFPDFAENNYRNPRIEHLKVKIINLDNGGENNINMFARATDDDNRAKDGNFLEAGKYIIA